MFYVNIENESEVSVMVVMNGEMRLICWENL